MNDSSDLHNAKISVKVEEGEIEEMGTNNLIENTDKEVQEYYKKLKNLGINLRCLCCGEVYSDPVKLKCKHLLDRNCIAAKFLKNNAIICPACQKETYCEDIDDLLTDFDIAAQIPPKPNSLIALINNKKSFRNDKYKRLKLDVDGKEIDRNDLTDDGEFDMINGVKIKKERLPAKQQRRRKKTRWSAIDEKKVDIVDTGTVVDSPQISFTGVISDILASSNIPKNITISQFKKFTEISNKTDIINMVTEAVMQNSRTENHSNDKRSHSLSDKEILDLIPTEELDDLFDIEKVQLIFLYREALDKGVLDCPSQKKNQCQPPVPSKVGLLPTPKTSSNGSVESQDKLSATSSRKRYTSESSKSSNISHRSSIRSIFDSTDSESAGENVSHHRQHKKHHRHRKSIVAKSTLSTNFANDNSKVQNSKPPVKTSATEINLTTTTTQEQQQQRSQNIATPPVMETQPPTNNLSTTKPITNDSQKMCDNIRYREDINRLHALYSTMYHASLKMKDFEHKIDSEDYQNSYKTYCDNYAEYQQLYSKLQSAINIDSISADKTDSFSNSYTSSDITPIVNGINANVSVNSVLSGPNVQTDTATTTVNTVSNVATSAVTVANQDQANSSAISTTYSIDPVEYVNDNKPEKTLVQHQQSTNSEVPAIHRNILSNYRQFSKEHSLDNKKKFGYLWISNLSRDVHTNDLCKAFGKFGHISKVKLFQYKANVPPTYFGLVFMPNYHEAENAMCQLQNKAIFDRPIQIKMLENDPLSDDRLV